MKHQLCLSLASLLVMTLAACGGTSPAPTPTSAPTVEALPTESPPTSVPPTLPPTAPPPTVTSEPVPLAPAPTDTVPAPATTDTLAPTATPTTVPATPRPRPTATSSGPLSADIYVANCRSAPTADKPGRVLVQISVEASGGNGRYRYFYQNKESPTKFIEVPGEQGTRLIGEVRVTSGDGQDLAKEFDIRIGDLSCP